MASKTVGVPYANGLLQAAVAEGSLERVRGDIAAIAKALAASTDLRRMLANPTIEPAQRKAVVREIAQKSFFAPLTVNFLSLLCDKGRIGWIGEIAEAFRKLSEARAGTVRAEVTSAMSLSAGEKESIRAALESATGRKVVIESHVDPSVIGGVRAKVEGKMYDGTIRARMERVREAMLAGR